MKRLKLRIAKFDKLLVVEQLEREGKFERTDHVKSDDCLYLFEDCIGLKRYDLEGCVDIIKFVDNAKRDEYAANLVKWITEEQFGGSGKLEIGKPCLVKNYEYIEWRRRFYAGKVAKQLGMDKRYLAYENPELDEFSRWKYAKPLNFVHPKIDGEIYTWEAEE